MRDKEGFSDGTVGAVQTFLFRGEDGPWTSESLSTLTGVDVVIRLSTALGQLGIYPPVDPLTSRSRLLQSTAGGRCRRFGGPLFLGERRCRKQQDRREDDEPPCKCADPGGR